MGDAIRVQDSGQRRVDEKGSRLEIQVRQPRHERSFATVVAPHVHIPARGDACVAVCRRCIPVAPAGVRLEDITKREVPAPIRPAAREDEGPAVQIPVARGERARLRIVGAHDLHGAGNREPVPSPTPSDSGAAGGCRDPEQCPRRVSERSGAARATAASSAAPDPREGGSARRPPARRGPAPRRSENEWGSERASSPEGAGTPLETPASPGPGRRSRRPASTRSEKRRPAVAVHENCRRSPAERSRGRRSHSPPRKRTARRRCCWRCHHGSTARGTSARLAASTPGRVDQSQPSASARSETLPSSDNGRRTTAPAADPSTAATPSPHKQRQLHRQGSGRLPIADRAEQRK